MSDYNWREEREKFLPDFMKQPEAEAGPAVRHSKGWLIVAIVAVLAAAAVAGAAVWYFVRKRAADPATMLAQAAERYKSAVGLVVLTIELQDGTKCPVPIGTAWAFAPDKFATNAHVAVGLIEKRDELKQNLAFTVAANIAKQNGFKDLKSYLDALGDKRGGFIADCRKKAERLIRGFDASIIINGSDRKSHPVKAVQIHRNFGPPNSNLNQDVAVFTVDGKTDVYFKTATGETLAALKSGEPVAFLGFPTEKLDGNNVNIDNPLASMQSGIVVAVSDFDMKDAGPKGNYMIRHNLPTTGGASGSPIFNRRGEVVALVYGMNIVPKKNKQGKMVDRIPSAAQINFGVRVDLLEGVGQPVGIKEFLAR
jgi:hypothetical protein